MVLGFNSWVQLNENDNLEAASVAKKIYRTLKSAGYKVDLTHQTEALAKKGTSARIYNADSKVSVACYVNWVHVVPVDSDTADSLISEFETDTLTAKKSKYNDELYSVAFRIKDRKQRQDFDVHNYSYKDKKNKNDRKREQE